MTELSVKTIRDYIKNSNNPLVFNGYVKKWKLCDWTLDQWTAVFGDKVIPFRCKGKAYLSDEPCWERKCHQKLLAFKEFVEQSSVSSEWMYFDYKYLHQWFAADNDFFRDISWADFGHPEKGAADSTVWVGSEGAHTPAHQDTYGYNIVTQLYGTKRWILFPPETGGMKATRVPYEESSIYSELNFYCPNNLDAFKALGRGFSVELRAGDALLVPRGWWHFVQNTSPIAISANVWLPHEEDKSSRVTEALIRALVAQLCKDLPEPTTKLLLNPNEDDLPDTPLSVLFLQLETVAKNYLDARRKIRRIKRQKTNEDSTSHTTTNKTIINPSHNATTVDNAMTVHDINRTETFNTEMDNNTKTENTHNANVDSNLLALVNTTTAINNIITATENIITTTNNTITANISEVPVMSNEELLNILRENIKKFGSINRVLEADAEDSPVQLHLTKAVIDAYCQNNVMEIVKQNLFAKLL